MLAGDSGWVNTARWLIENLRVAVFVASCENLRFGVVAELADGSGIRPFLWS